MSEQHCLRLESCEITNERNGGGHVYFIRSQQNSVMKIGMAKDPFARMRTIQTGHPNKLFMWATISTQKKNTLEKDLHELFKQHKIRGEWFEFNASTLEKLRWFCSIKNLFVRFYQCLEIAMQNDFRILVQKNSYGPGVYIGLIVNNVKVCHFVVLNRHDFFTRLVEIIESSGVENCFSESEKQV